MHIHIFKIKDAETGLFSTGGASPRWTSKGKTWNGLNHIKSHLRQQCSYKKLQTTNQYGIPDTDWKTMVNKIPTNWIVIELISDGVKTDVKEYQASMLYPLEFKA